MSANRKIALAGGIFFCVAGLWWMATTGQRSLPTYTYSQFLNQIESGQVASVVVNGSNAGAVEATCRLKDGKAARTVLPADYQEALLAMQDQLVNIEIRDAAAEPLRLLAKATPFLLLVVVWAVLMMRNPKGFKQTFWG